MDLTVQYCEVEKSKWGANVPLLRWVGGWLLWYLPVRTKQHHGWSGRCVFCPGLLLQKPHLCWCRCTPGLGKRKVNQGESKEGSLQKQHGWWRLSEVGQAQNAQFAELFYCQSIFLCAKCRDFPIIQLPKQKNLLCRQRTVFLLCFFCSFICSTLSSVLSWSYEEMTASKVCMKKIKSQNGGNAHGNVLFMDSYHARLPRTL